MAPLALSQRELLVGVDHLAARDRDLAAVVERFGPPPLWSRPPGFPTLVMIVLEQQVSLQSARAAFNRLVDEISEVKPPAFLALDDATLKKIGFSRQKALYCRELASALLDGRFDLDAVDELGDEEARGVLMQLKGIGRWTADIYLLMALGRPDIWPTGDLALAKEVARLKGLDSIPGDSELEEIAATWKPWRAVAARMIWHHYLSRAAAREP